MGNTVEYSLQLVLPFYYLYVEEKKRNALFDIDTVKEKIEEEKCCVANVKEQVGNLRKFNVREIFLSKGLTFTEDENLQLLAAQLTFQGVCNLRKAIQHVPCPTFLSVNDGQMNLRKHKSASDMFISPPVASCIKCDKALTDA